MNANAELFLSKISLLKERLFEKGEIDAVLGKFCAFISVCDSRERAYVFRASKDSAEASAEAAAAEAAEFISENDLSPLWVKLDVLKSGEKALYKDVLKTIGEGYGQFFRRGISFDEDFSSALIEAELNACGLINYKKKSIELPALNNYLAENELKTLSQFPDEVILFDCESFFCDEKSEVYELYGSGNDCGRRIIDKIDAETAKRVVITAADYLSMQIGLDGKFDYGFYPINHKEIGGYNMLRHASSIWSLLCAYRITGDRFAMEQAQNAAGYMIRNIFRKYPDTREENVSFLADKTKGEVKIGGNAVAIIVLTELMSITGEDKYIGLITELGNGILELFDERDGSFFHVLRYPTLAPRDKFRTVYYDGETVFALCRLYGYVKDERYIEAAAAAADRFIKENYAKHADHWVAYSMNELAKYRPEEKYLEFAMKNVSANLKKIYDQPTTFHTYLELLCVSFELYSRIKSEKLKCTLPEGFDEKQFVKTIFRRAEYMLNGYCYPEYVMYFKYPETSLGAFFVRHDSYRIRIDDVQHFCGAYYAFYKNYDKLCELL